MKGIVKGSKCIKCGCRKWIKGEFTEDSKTGFFYSPYFCKNCGYEGFFLDYALIDKINKNSFTAS